MSEQTPDPTVYFNIADNLMSMHMHEREEMFKLFTENRELFAKLIPSNLLFDVLEDPTVELDHPLVRHFQDWSKSQLLPK
jgi:hypothetical protein